MGSDRIDRKTGCGLPSFLAPMSCSGYSERLANAIRYASQLRSGCNQEMVFGRVGDQRNPVSLWKSWMTNYVLLQCLWLITCSSSVNDLLISPQPFVRHYADCTCVSHRIHKHYRTLLPDPRRCFWLKKALMLQTNNPSCRGSSTNLMWYFCKALLEFSHKSVKQPE